MDDVGRRKLLGEFLRTRRARRMPQELGIVATGRRRTPGLRREEVAAIAGVGVTWYTWLEQGRAISVSDDVLASISRALMLDPDESLYLFTLAQTSRRVAPMPPDCERISPALEALLHHQGVFPTFLLDPSLTILHWNRSASLLMGGLDEMPADDRNHLWLLLTSPTIRRALAQWEQHAQRLLAEFRVRSIRHLGNPTFEKLIERLHTASPEFRQWWPRHEVVGHLRVTKQFDIPGAGCLWFEQTRLQVSENPDLTLVVKVPIPGTGTVETLTTFLAMADS